MINSSIIRILYKGQTLGTGFLIARSLVVTCSHIIKGAGKTALFQFNEWDEIISAQIIPEYYREAEYGDITFLRLRGIPENIIPLQLGAAENSTSGNSFQAFGFPRVCQVEGIHAWGEILGTVTKNGQRLLQLGSEELDQGFSGAPVWDEKRGAVVGMVVNVYQSDARGADR